MKIRSLDLSARFFCAIVVTCVLTAGSASAEEPPDFLLKWGSLGAGAGQFNLPRRLAVTATGTVFVSDRNNSRIQKFTRNGVFLTQWGSPGTAAGQFDFPFGIAVDDNSGHVYVAERNNNRIQKFTSNGTHVTQWGVAGGGNGQFNFPIAVDVDANGNVYVGDSFNHRIQVFTSTGIFLRKWGSLGAGNGQFRNPIGIAVSGGFVYVGDAGNHRIQKFALGGAFITQWGSFGAADGQFNSPRGIGVDNNGDVCVADTINNRVQKFTANGTHLVTWGTPGAGHGQFNRLEDVDIDASGNIFIADANNNRIQKFGHAAVPVTLSSFDVRRIDDGVEITWAVADPVADAVRFNVLRRKAGAATPPHQIHAVAVMNQTRYRFVDVAAPAAGATYWLEEIGLDGTGYLHGPLSVESIQSAQFGLESAFPNPFNPSTTITFLVPAAAMTRLSIFDVRGHLVTQLVGDVRPAGRHETSWNGLDQRGIDVASGVYLARLESAGRTATRRLVLLK
jgi:DNA-binding beta-propeller fold protein YncE